MYESLRTDLHHYNHGYLACAPSPPYSAAKGARMENPTKSDIDPYPLNGLTVTCSLYGRTNKEKEN